MGNRVAYAAVRLLELTGLVAEPSPFTGSRALQRPPILAGLFAWTTGLSPLLPWKAAITDLQIMIVDYLVGPFFAGSPADCEDLARLLQKAFPEMPPHEITATVSRLAARANGPSALVAHGVGNLTKETSD